ncbi:MAG TPA: tetratricopeptide repeat protein [Kofleriaceae bacterium]|nr:tetratricopeptide repeat protein [Kofleriaceae bacterium]
MALLLLAPTLHAEETSPANKAKAKAKIKRARVFFEGGSYDQAVAEYLAAYRLMPAPDILYNVGQILRTKPDPQKAIAAYRKYLEVAPEGNHAEEAQGFIKELFRELVPEGTREKYDAVNEELAAFRAKHGDALDDRMAAIHAQLLTADRDVDMALSTLRGDIEKQMKPKPVIDDRATARAIDTTVTTTKKKRTPAPFVPHPIIKKWWFWAAVGGGAAVLVLGVGLGAGLSGDRDPTASIGVLR